MVPSGDIVASIVRSAQGRANLSGIVRDALTAALREASEVGARKAVLEGIERAIDETLFPPGSLRLVVTMIQQLDALRGEVGLHSPPSGTPEPAASSAS